MEATVLLGLPIPPAALLALARAHVKGERWDQAAADYARVLDLLPDGGGVSPPRQTACAELARWDEVFERVVRLRPNDANLWIGRGRHFALRRDWARAAAAYAQIIAAPSLRIEHFEYACVLRLHGDRASYETLCKDLMNRAATNKQPYAAYVLARTFAL